jgi:YidC/Oxa1 family membrane protein insertase
MDRKSLIILAASVVLLLAGSKVVDHFFPPKPIPASVLAMTNEQPGSATALATATGSNAPGPVTSVYSAPLAQPSEPEQTLTVTNEDLIFNFTSHGGGLKTISLKKYPAIISRTGETNLESNPAVLNTRAPAPVLTLLGHDTQGDNYFNLTQNGRVVRAEKTLANGLRLVKEFDIGTNYLFTASVRLENTSAQPLKIPARELVVGTATPIGPLDDPTTLGMFWYNGVKAQNIKQPWFDNHLGGCALLPATPRTVYEEGTNNVIWTSVHNQFFTLAAIPANPAPRVMIHPVSIPPPEMVGLTNATSASLTNGFEVTCWYPETVLPPHQALTGDFTFYAGPKEYKRLAQIGDRMNNKLDLIMDFSGFTGFFSKMLLISMNGLHAIGMGKVGYGWIIIAITLIIKGVFWPLTKASTRSQKRMQALQPQMKAIADKYKDDPVKKNQKTMDFMKENKVSPLGSCLPMMIQIPVFFGFYYMLRNAIELRGVPFLWAHDLSQPDTVAYLPFLGGFPINPLPLIMGATQLWQAHILPPSPGVDPGQQKIMRYMPLMFIAMFYRMPAGLTLYYTVQNLLGILQTRMTKLTDEPAAKPGAVVPKKKM